MTALIFIYILYMTAATVVTLVGFFWLIINSTKGIPYKKALNTLLMGIIMFVIGFGTCIALIKDI